MISVGELSHTNPLKIELELLDHLRRFCDDIMESSFFESWVYQTPCLEEFLPLPLYHDVLTCDYTDWVAIKQLRKRIKIWIRERFPAGCKGSSSTDGSATSDDYIDDKYSPMLRISGESIIKDLHQEHSAAMLKLRQEFAKSLQEKDAAIEAIIREKTLGFPWLADALAKYQALSDAQYVEMLVAKERPALKTAHYIRELSAEKRQHQREARILRSRILYYESLFPWLSEYVGADIDALLSEVNNDDEGIDADRAAIYLSPDEYSSLPSAKRYQLALDRYWMRRKSAWEIGRDYERYIGYLYERQGYTVEYYGIERGLCDLGRDLICTKENEVLTVQCKCWKTDKVLREKHIAQLFGTTVLNNMTHENRKLFPKSQDILHGGVMATSTTLSDTAREFAIALSITVRERLLLERYPCIKCNPVGNNGDPIYHLPFDQQYDNVIMGRYGRFYVSTVAEAEKLRFRRARRWRPENDSTSSSPNSNA